MRTKSFVLSAFAVLLAALSLGGCRENVDGPAPQHKNISFDIQKVVASYTQLSVNVLPKDKEQEYIIFLAEKKHFVANHIDTREELIEDDYIYFTELAERFDMGLKEFLETVGWLAKGDNMGFGAKNLYPNTEYVFYCYGVEFDGEYYEPTTEVSYTVLKTTAPKMIDVDFEVKSTVDGNVVKLEVDPKGYEGYYYSYIIPDNDPYFLHEGMKMDENYISHYRNKAFDDFREFINDDGLTIEDFCHSGKSTINRRLDPMTNYQVVLFAVTDSGDSLLSSVPQTHNFSTTDVNMSDFVIDLKVTDIHPYYAELTITPSNKTERYACVHLSANQVPNHVDEYEKMLAILEYYAPAILSGTFSERMMPLTPNTDYCVLAFGVDGNLPTTQLFRYDYTSAHAEPGKIDIESIDLVKLFDAREIEALDPSYKQTLAECSCVAIVEMKTTAPTDKVYFWWFEEWQKYEYSEEAFLEDLLLYPPTSPLVAMDLYYSESEDDRFLFAGIAEDEDGNMSPIYYSDFILLSEDQCSPAEEFFQYALSPSASSAILGIR